MSRRREELVPDKANFIVLESYLSSSEGPTIHVDVQSVGRLTELEAIMRSLGGGMSPEVRLSALADTHWVAPLIDVVLSVGSAWATPRIRYDEHGEQLVCKWTDSLEGWIDSADKTAAMTASGKPCHQYFSDRHAALRHTDLVTVEIGFLE